MSAIRLIILSTGLVATLLFSQIARSQTEFELTIEQFDGESVRGYVQPIGDMFGANLNAGLYHSARIANSGFHMRIDLVGAATFVGDGQKTYNAELPDGFIPDNGSYKTATVFGGRGTTFRDANSGLEYKGSDGIFNTRIFPLLMPQLSIGSFFGTELSIRYMATPALGSGKFPSTTLFGFGIRHSISNHFGWPIDIALGMNYSKFTASTIIESEGESISLQASKEFSFVTLYAGLAFETSSTKIQYDTKSAGFEQAVTVSLAGANKFRMTTGIQLDVQAFQLFADANFGNVKHFSGGLAFGF